MTPRGAQQALTLTPVEELSRQDQLALLAVRNQPRIRESSFNRREITASEHIAWIAEVGGDPAHRFFAVRSGDTVIGGVGVKNIDPDAGSAEWSFYLSEDWHGAGTGLAMAELALNEIFGAMAIRTVIGETLASNEISGRFHRKLGFREVERERRQLDQPEPEDIVIYRLQAADWPGQRSD
jgi:RimJ/RimL family protein N-acetyltransferase